MVSFTQVTWTENEEWGGLLKIKLLSLEEALGMNRQHMSMTLAATFLFPLVPFVVSGSLQGGGQHVWE